MSLLAMLKGKGDSGFGYGSTAEEVTEGLDLTGMTFLLTGCNSGLGQETMRVLTMRGATILGLARSMEKATEACRPFGERAVPFECDLSEPASIMACVEAIRGMSYELDGIIANAGIMALPKLHKAHGYELQFFTNHIGHFILVTELLDQLKNVARVVIVSSMAHRQAPPGGILFDRLSGEGWYKSWVAYGQSKLANILFAKELAQRFEGTNHTANALHPGVIRTNLSRHMGSAANVMMALMGPLFMKTIPQGAATQCYAAVHPDAAVISGAYFDDCNIGKPTDLANDLALAKKLWDVSEEIKQKVLSEH
ncbi:SDR family NAD(P)-dependent oxidoreductase [bacterium]|nr:SDR family NAD(P)-dependent oxidoreductase [bacterium]